MRSLSLLSSAVHIFVVLIILMLGSFFLAIPYAVNFQIKVVDLLLYKPMIFFYLGLGFLVSGTLLLGGFFLFHRKRFFQVKMENTKASIDLSIIEEYVARYWKEIFPDKQVPSDVVLKGRGKLELVTELPKMEEEEKSQLLLRIQNELGVLLARKLGYEKDFLLTVVES